ncbi:MAG TPA: hypothetical protein VHP83_10160 [Aggregatilineaceae bacterium]|nr:hypothetical protein [Aggregatilineaceae bacterium]
MFEAAMDHGLFSLAELNRLRLEAMHLFEQCLTNGDESVFIAFVERQVTHNPPRLQLLRELADDLQQRLLSLQEYHFDVRERVVRALSESYGVDITSLAPPAMLSTYHSLNIETLLDFVNQKNIGLSQDDKVLLRKMVDASLQMAAQLYSDIELTTRLHSLVLDWWEGMNATTARQIWNTNNFDQQPGTFHH